MKKIKQNILNNYPALDYGSMAKELDGLIFEAQKIMMKRARNFTELSTEQLNILGMEIK